MIQCSPICYIIGAILLLLLPLNWLFSAIFAALVHELCHILAVCLMGGKIRKIQISPGGCVIECWHPEPAAKVFSILAGPLGSFSLLFFRRIYPQIAVCGLIQGIFNLLPVFPLDGGRILQLLLEHFVPTKADCLLKAIRNVIILVLLGWMFWLKTDLFTVIFVLVCLLRPLPRKFPCKVT